MGLQDRDYVREDYRSDFRLETMSIVVRLIVVNVAIYLLDLIFGGGSELRIEHRVLAVTQNTLFQPWMWWQFLTSGFAHSGPSHLAFNMFGLYFFGRELEYYFGKREFLTFYLCSLVFSSVASCTFHAVTEPGIPFSALGASGGVVAVVISFCIRFPLAPIIRFPFTLPAWMVGLFYVVSDLGGLMSPALRFTSENIGYDCHLAGAAFAGLYWLAGFRLSSLFDNSWVGDLKRRFRRMNSPLRLHQPSLGTRQQRDEEDRILAKVHEQGIDSLTPKEKKILEEYSRRLRSRSE